MRRVGIGKKQPLSALTAYDLHPTHFLLFLCRQVKTSCSPITFAFKPFASVVWPEMGSCLPTVHPFSGPSKGFFMPTPNHV